MNSVPATYKIIYNQKNITTDISDHLLSMNYTDKVAGESDEIELTVHDKDGLWQNDWWPSKGDTIEAQIIHQGEVLDCGKFSIDELGMASGREGDVFTLRGLAATFSKALRTKNSSAHENKTLRELAKSFADKHGFTLLGEIDEIRIGRVTQYQKTDLSFLRQVAEDYGYTFSVRGSLLVFTNEFELESVAPSTTIDKTEMKSFGFTDKTEATYKKALLRHHNKKKNEVIETEVSLMDENTDSEGNPFRDGSEDQLIIHDRVENDQQAETKARAKLHKKSKLEKFVDVQIPGNVLVVSGVALDLTGCGRFSGKYQVAESSHSLDRGGGYNTSFRGVKVNTIPTSKHYPKQK